MASLTVSELFRQARGVVYDSEGALWGDLDARISDAITCLFEAMAESEAEHRAGVKLYERGPARKHQRNGYRKRQVQTAFSNISIRIPRLREDGFIPSFLEPNRRAIGATENWVQKAFLCGISRAEINRLMESATGCRPSEGLLRRVQAQLDARATAFRERALTQRYSYLFLDAAYVKDIIGLRARRICILVAFAVTDKGEREILGFERATRESAASWSRFLSGLVKRGMDPEFLELVISDEHEGIKKAVEDTLGDVPHQLCWAHRCRNIFEAVNKCDRKEMAESLRAIYRASHLTEAKVSFRTLKTRWANEYPNLVAHLEEDMGNLLAFYACPQLHREYLRTSNPVERLFLELRRSRFACGAFANRQACDRVTASVFLRLNDLYRGTDIWREREVRSMRAAERKKADEQAASPPAPQDATADRLAHRTDPVSGARVAPQHCPILPDGCPSGSTGLALVPA